MDLCEHINGYSLALKYFPRCFDKNLQLKDSDKLENMVNKKINVLRKYKNVNYKEILFAYKYIIDILGSSKKTFDSIRNIDIMEIYLRYEDTLKSGDKRGDGYNYLFLLTVIKKPILEVLRSIDSRLSCFSNDEKAVEIKNFISKWHQLLNPSYDKYNYINLPIFISELNELSRDNPMLMGYNSIFDDVLIQINDNPNVLKRKK